MWATALYYPLIFWTLRGLEPGLLAVLVEAAVLLAWGLRRAHDATIQLVSPRFSLPAC